MDFLFPRWSHSKDNTVKDNVRSRVISWESKNLRVSLLNDWQHSNDWRVPKQWRSARVILENSSRGWKSSYIEPALNLHHSLSVVVSEQHGKSHEDAQRLRPWLWEEKSNFVSLLLKRVLLLLRTFSVDLFMLFCRINVGVAVLTGMIKIEGVAHKF